MDAACGGSELGGEGRDVLGTRVCLWQEHLSGRGWLQGVHVLGEDQVYQPMRQQKGGSWKVGPELGAPEAGLVWGCRLGAWLGFQILEWMGHPGTRWPGRKAWPVGGNCERR